VSVLQSNYAFKYSVIIINYIYLGLGFRVVMHVIMHIYSYYYSKFM